MQLNISFLVLLFIQTIKSNEQGGFDLYEHTFDEIISCATGELLYPFCAVQEEESPRDIITDNLDDSAEDDICDETLDWEYYGSSWWRIIRKEYTLEVEAVESEEEDAEVKNTNYNHIALFENPVDFDELYDSSDGKKDKYVTDLVDEFCFSQIHFHWDLVDELGSEHALNGEKFPLEAHFVHFNCEKESVGAVVGEYSTQEEIEAAEAAGIDTHELAVIGIWFEISDEPNEAMELIISTAESFNDECENSFADETDDGDECRWPTCGEDEEEFIDGVQQCVSKTEEPSEAVNGIDLTDILTDDILDNGFYTYEGSLTTPPCTTDVRWFVMRQTATISTDQMERLRNITRPSDCTPIAPNWRPLQENENEVYACFDDDDSSDDYWSAEEALIEAEEIVELILV